MRNNEIVLKHLEVVVEDSFESAYRRFKILVQNDGVLSQYKNKRFYEKPSEKKRRKKREAAERRWLASVREEQILSGEWDKRQKLKEKKRQEKIEKRKREAQSESL